MSDVNSELDKLEKQQELRNEARFFKFADVGDTIQGTLVGRYRTKSQLNQDQIVYIVRNQDGIWNVAFNANYPIHRDLADAVVGQVARFSFTGTKPHSVKGYNPIKLMTVVTRPDLLDNDSAEYLESVGLKVGAPLPAAGELPEDEEEEEQVAEEPAQPTTNSRPIGGTIPRS